MPDGSGSIWKRMRRRKRERMTVGSLEFGVRGDKSGVRSNNDWQAQRTRISRIPSSIRENAQSSTEPKATGVKMIKRIKITLIVRRKV